MFIWKTKTIISDAYVFYENILCLAILIFWSQNTLVDPKYRTRFLRKYNWKVDFQPNGRNWLSTTVAFVLKIAFAFLQKSAFGHCSRADLH